MVGFAYSAGCETDRPSCRVVAYSGLKVVAEYPKALWHHDGLTGAAFSQAGPLQEIHDMSGPDGAPAAPFGFTYTSRQCRARLTKAPSPRPANTAEPAVSSAPAACGSNTAITVTSDLLDKKIDEGTWRTRANARAAYRLRPKAAPDDRGARRMLCPAAGTHPTVACPVKRRSLGRDPRHPLVDIPPAQPDTP